MTGDAGAGVADGDGHHPGGRASGDLDHAARRRIAGGVGYEVGHYLVQSVAVGEDGRQAGRHGQADGEVFRGQKMVILVRFPGEESGQVQFLRQDGQFTGLELGEVQKVAEVCGRCGRSR